MLNAPQTSPLFEILNKEENRHQQKTTTMSRNECLQAAGSLAETLAGAAEILGRLPTWEELRFTLRVVMSNSSGSDRRLVAAYAAIILDIPIN
jgi:hypothetical protein